MKKIVIWLFITVLVLCGVKIALAANNNSNNSATVASTIYSETSDPISGLTQNRNFVAHGLEIKDTNEVFKVTRSIAIQKATTIEGQDIAKQASSITAVKGNFTDNESPKIPESNIILKDYPVWIVTFHDVTLQMDGPLPKNMDNNTNQTFIADINVIIDGNTAEFLGSFAYNK
jgi:hypothetical protein